MKNFLKYKKDQFETLKKISKLINNLNIEWVIFGSSALLLHGININPKDIDIITNKSGYEKINNYFKQKNYKTLEKKTTPNAKYNSITYLINKIETEIINNFEIIDNQKNIIYPKNKIFKCKEYIKLSNPKIKLPIPNIYELKIIYELMGRKKDIDKIDMINNIINI